MSLPITTRDAKGHTNGWLLPLWNVNTKPELRPDQVYLTVVAPGCSKGPHLHMKREQRYYLISGDAEVVTRFDGQYTVTLLWRGDWMVVPAGIPSQIRNRNQAEEAWIINMPAPAWSKDDQDEWPVENWDT